MQMYSRLKGIFVKYNYLIRFVVTLGIALYIPALIFGFTLIRHSYNEMLERNEEFYRETTASFLVYFNGQLNVLKNHANSIAKGTGDGGKFISKEVIESHPYHYITATKALVDNKIGLPISTDLGVYFKDTDYIITSAYKYKVEDFFNAYDCKSQAQIEKIQSFFTDNSETISLYSTFDHKGYSDSRLFIGVPVTFPNQHKALIFYMLRYDSINTSFFAQQGSENLRLCLFNSDGSLLYTNETSALNLLDDSEFIRFLGDETSMFRKSLTDEGYTAFKIKNQQLNTIFVSIVPQDQVERNLIKFYSLLKNNAILIALGFVILLFFTVYINYSPLRKLLTAVMSKYSDVGVKSEISTISSVFDKINYEYERMGQYVSEQQIMLMEYIIGNLLHGIPIPQPDVEKLDERFQGGSFCVITIADMKLDTKGREMLASYIFSTLNVPIYITDLLYRNHGVLLCVLKDAPDDDIIGKLVGGIRRYLLNQWDVSCKIGGGHRVSDINDIRKSYMNALHVMESTTVDLFTPTDKIPIMENYPSEEIASLINYIKNGEGDNAVEALERIAVFLNGIDTVFLRRYICYDLLITYINCLQDMKYPLGKKEAVDLLAHGSIEELFRVLSDSIKLTSRGIAHNRDNLYNALQKDVLEYVKENFADPDITRTQVADIFGISIYSLSRLFKDHIGIGFKEYISYKRMEMSKHLLATTDDSIGDISIKIGLTDPNYFSRLFKMNYGISPTQFRGENFKKGYGL